MARATSSQARVSDAPDLALDSGGDGGDPVVELVAVGRHAGPDAAQGSARRNEIICVHFQDHGSSLAEQASRAPRLSTGPRPTVRNPTGRHPRRPGLRPPSSAATQAGTARSSILITKDRRAYGLGSFVIMER